MYAILWFLNGSCRCEKHGSIREASGRLVWLRTQYQNVGVYVV